MGANVAQRECDGSSRSEKGKPGLKFLVEEGPFVYELPCPTAGWGAVISGATRATVMMVRSAHSSNGGFEVFGRAEVRVDNLRPQHNATLFSAATGSLLKQGADRRKPQLLKSAPSLRVPVPGMATKARRIVCRLIQMVSRLRNPSRVQWTIGILEKWDVASGVEFPWKSVRWFDPPRDGFIADPFLVEDAGRTWLFYERLMFDENLGTLWVAPFDPKRGMLDGGVEILRAPFHLSFPNVFSHEGHWYMLPEQGRSGTTTLYRARNFPYEWEPHRDLLAEFPGIDPVLLFRNGRWWLFVTHGSPPCNENNLYLFSAPDLESEFLPHPMNPIATGLHGARMAGRLLERGDRLFRPGQDGRDGYGGGLVLFEVTNLTPDAYAEVLVRTISPDPEGPYPFGLHSYCESSSFVIVDGERLAPQPRRRTRELVALAVQKLRGRLAH